MSDRVIRDIFCKKCHKLAAQVEKGEEGTKVMQGGKTVLSLGKDPNISMKGNKVSVKCGSGHNVQIEV